MGLLRFGGLGRLELIHGEVIVHRDAIKGIPRCPSSGYFGYVRRAKKSANQTVAVNRIEREVIHIDEPGRGETGEEEHKSQYPRPGKTLESQVSEIFTRILSEGLV